MKLQPLEKLEELELIKLSQAGNSRATLALLTRHKSFVKMLVNRITYPDWLAMEDVMQEANIGMMNAIQSFDVNSGNKLITYSFWIVKKAISDHMNKMGYMASIPFLKLVELKTHLNKLDREPENVTQEEREKFNKFSKSQLRSLAAGVWSFEAPNYRQHNGLTQTSDDDESTGLASLNNDSSLLSPSTESRYVSESLTTEILDILGDLTALDGVAVCQYLGIYLEDAQHNKRAITGRLTTIEDGELVPGANGFGIQIGRNYNQISKSLEVTLLQLRTRIQVELGDTLHEIGL